MRVVGYYNSGFNDVIDKINLKALTHLNYGFLLPASDGSVYFKDEEEVKKVVKICKNMGLKIYISVGGSHDGEIRLDKSFESICDKEKYMENFVKNIMKIVDIFDFDGVDLDWEYPWKRYKEKFEKMVTLISQNIRLKNKGFTLAIHRAVEGEYKFNRLESITEKVINMVDWVNIMTYDDTDEDNHSSIERNRKSLEYWSISRNISKDKLLTGVAFYSRPSLRPYYEIIADEDRSAFNDFWGEDSYNGIYTVKEKIELGKEYGGVIIWAINFDADKENEYSLLNVIEDLTKKA